MASSTRNPSASASIVTGWSNVSNVYSSNDLRATASLTTAVMAATGFGFSIPVSSTILGIEIVTEYQGSGNNTSRRELTVQLTKDGSAGVGTASAFSATAANTDQIFTVGGSADLLGNTLTAAEVNASTFGVLLKPSNVGSYARSVDHVYLVVYYESPVMDAESTTQVILGAVGVVIKLSNVTGSPGATALNGVASILAKNGNLSAGIEGYAVTGTDASFELGIAEEVDNILTDSTGEDITDSTGEQILTGGPLIAQLGSIEITGTDVEFDRFKGISTSPGEILVVGVDAEITYVSSVLTDNILYDSDGNAILDSTGDWILTDGPYTLPIMIGSIVITGLEVSFEVVSGFNLEAGEVLIERSSVSIVTERDLSLAPGAISGIGYAAIITNVRKGNLDSGVITLSGLDASIEISIGGISASGEVLVTGFPQFDNILRDDLGDPILDSLGNLIFTDATVFALPASIAITGADSIGVIARQIVSLPGTIAITGVPATFTKTITSIAEVGSTQILGKTASTTATRTLYTESTAYSLSGIIATLSRQINYLNAVSGIVVVTGQVATSRTTYAIEALYGAYDITGYATEFDLTAAEQILQANSDTIVVNGLEVSFSRTWEVSSGTLSISGQSTSLTVDKILTTTVGEIITSGVSVTETLSRVFSVDSGAVQVSGFISSITATRTVLPDVGVLSISGSISSVIANRNLTLGIGTTTLVGSSAITSTGRVLDASYGTVILSGYAVTIITSHVIEALSESYVVEGYAVDFDLITGEKIIYANPGIVYISGESAVINRSVLASPESFSISGQSATLASGTALIAEAGEVVTSGENTTLTIARSLHSSNESIAITGTSASVIVARAVEAAYAALGITGVDGSLVVGTFTDFSADLGNYNSTGVEAFAILIRALMAGDGPYTISGYTAYNGSANPIPGVNQRYLVNSSSPRLINVVDSQRDIINVTPIRILELL